MNADALRTRRHRLHRHPGLPDQLAARDEIAVATVVGARFGLGAGTGTPALHDADHDFPDALIAANSDVFLRLINAVLED